MSEFIQIEYTEGNEFKTDTCETVGALPCYITALIRKGVTRILVNGTAINTISFQTANEEARRAVCGEMTEEEALRACA